MDSSIHLRSKMISVYSNLVFYVFLFIKISSICPAAADNDPKYTQDVLLSEKGYFNSTQSAGFFKNEELKSSLGTRCSTFKKHYFFYLGPMKGERLDSFMVLNS